MNSRIISYQIGRKVNAWLSSIKDKDLQDYLYDKVVVTGGCIASMLLNEPVNDYDIYLTTKEAVKRVAEYYVTEFKKNHPKINKDISVVDGDTLAPGGLLQYGLGPGRVAIVVKSAGVAGDDENISDPENVSEADDDLDLGGDKAEKPKDGKEFKPVYLTSNAITLSDKVQIVIRFYGSPEEVHKNFDFVHVLSYWQSGKHDTNRLHLNPHALECLLTKELRYVGSKYPVCSIIRIRKFLKRGFHINAGEILKICFQLHELNLKDVAVLADQLVGVDTTYFSMMIADMTEKKEKDKDFEVSYGYLASIIDEVFDNQDA